MKSRLKKDILIIKYNATKYYLHGQHVEGHLKLVMPTDTDDIHTNSLLTNFTRNFRLKYYDFFKLVVVGAN